MTRFEAIEARLDAPADAQSLLRLAEEVLESWVTARGQTPTVDLREGFRLLALHHQGASGTPSFNACRETCREIAYTTLLSLDGQTTPGSASRGGMLVANSPSSWRQLRSRDWGTFDRSRPVDIQETLAKEYNG